MVSISKFTYPFCYTPTPEISAAAQRLTAMIDADSELSEAFSEGKMLGVLEVEDKATGEHSFLYGFSGNVGGRSRIAGFVPPIYDLMDPDGTYKQREAEISAINNEIASGCSLPEEEMKVLKEKRHAMSIELQQWIFRQYIVMNASGEERSILDIFADMGHVPPGGTGDCAAPKLLNHAYRNGLKPISLGEFWYGKAPLKEVRLAGAFYPACTGKCGPLLSWMMRGLEVQPNPLDSAFEGEKEPRVIYEDQWLIIADKPSGMLAVPGRTGKKSLQETLSEQFGQVTACHRLDMDTAGIIVFARTPEVHAAMEQLFEHREVHKSYRARLIPTPHGKHLTVGAHGTISLPLICDWYDRPRQMVDFEDGKKALTEYAVEAIQPDGCIDVRFTPLTGRTHQLRVHAAHAQGLGHPIKGDRLYGGGEGQLALIADRISFRHPVTDKIIELTL